MFCMRYNSEHGFDGVMNVMSKEDGDGGSSDDVTYDWCSFAATSDVVLLPLPAAPSPT